MPRILRYVDPRDRPHRLSPKPIKSRRTRSAIPPRRVGRNGRGGPVRVIHSEHGSRNKCRIRCQLLDEDSAAGCAPLRHELRVPPARFAGIHSRYPARLRHGSCDQGRETRRTALRRSLPSGRQRYGTSELAMRRAVLRISSSPPSRNDCAQRRLVADLTFAGRPQRACRLAFWRRHFEQAVGRYFSNPGATGPYISIAFFTAISRCRTLASSPTA
jgi:hypothetical protein